MPNKTKGKFPKKSGVDKRTNAGELRDANTLTSAIVITNPGTKVTDYITQFISLSSPI